MVLVVGATGVLGRRVCRMLVEQGAQVRALVRDGTDVSRVLDLPLEIVSGDLRDRSSLEAAVEGCGTIIDCAAGRPTRTDRHNDARAVDDLGTSRLVDVARAAGVRRFVYVSALGSAPNAPLEWLRMKYRAEWHVLHSGMHFTILRPAALAETWLEPLADRVHAGKPVWIPGRGLEPVSWVAADDVARLAVLALTDSDLEDRTVDVGGPVPITVEEAVAAMEAAAGRHVTHVHVPPSLLRLASAAWVFVDPAWAHRLSFGWCVARHPQVCEVAGLQRMLPEWHPSPVEALAAEMTQV